MLYWTYYEQECDYYSRMQVVLPDSGELPRTCIFSWRSVSDGSRHIISLWIPFLLQISPAKIQKRILIPLKGMDQNARLLAKEAHLWMWEPAQLNFLLWVHGQESILEGEPAPPEEKHG